MAKKFTIELTRKEFNAVAGAVEVIRREAYDSERTASDLRYLNRLAAALEPLHDRLNAMDCASS